MIQAAELHERNAEIGHWTYQNKTPPVDIREVPYRPAASGLAVETFTLSSLQARRGSDLRRLQRLQFELLIWCREGGGRHEVDFEPVALEPGSVLHVRPGQVHRWALDEPYDARLILLQPVDLRHDWSPGPRLLSPTADLIHDLEAVVALADRSQRSAPLSVRSLEAIRDLLVELLGIDRPPRPTLGETSLLHDLSRLLGQADPFPRTVQDCARLLGCSTRTLARACQREAGATPKELIDRAVALEAQRRLSTTEQTATQVATDLGFAELSHFTRFFRRVTGETPSQFSAGFA